MILILRERFKFGEFDEVLEQGDSYSIPENVKHSMEVLETGTVINFFHHQEKIIFND